MKLVALLLAPAFVSCGLMDSDKRDRRVVARVEEPAVAPTAAPGVPNSPRETDAGRGLPGQDGRDGPQGPQGLAGVQGEPGQSIVGPAGPAGPQGAQGLAGPAGQVGPQGAQGPAGPAGPSGVQGNTGPQGVPGAPAFLPAYVVHATAQRTYNPTTFAHFDDIAGPGIYGVPQELALFQGAAGTGWARLQLGNYAFCYQGNAQNNAQQGTAFALKGVVHYSIACESNQAKPFAGYYVMGQSGVLRLSVPGGGLNNPLQASGTVVTMQLHVVPFNL